MARQQAQLAQDYQQLSQSPQERGRIQQRNQRQLASAAERLADQFAETSEQLSSEPLDMVPEGQRAEAAQQSVQEGQQSMQQAVSHLGHGDSGDAGRAAEQAALALREAARQADETAAQNRPSQSPVPGEVGAQVSEAARQLQQAQQQLAQAAQQSAAQGSQSPQQSSSAGQSQSSNSQDSQNGQTSSSGAESQPSNTPLAQSSQNMQQAAQSLTDAAGKLQPSSDAAAGAGAKSMSTLQDGNSQADSADGNDGTGGKALPDLSSLDIELQKLTSRDWGQLPGRLRTEILQASRKKPNGEYAKLIKLYFREIAQTRGQLSQPSTGGQ